MDLTQTIAKEWGKPLNPGIYRTLAHQGHVGLIGAVTAATRVCPSGMPT